MGSGASKPGHYFGELKVPSTQDNMDQNAITSSPHPQNQAARNSTGQNLYLAQTIPSLVVSAKKVTAAKKREKEKVIKKILQEYPELADSLTCAREWMKEIGEDVEEDVRKKKMSLRSKKWFEELYTLFFEHEQAEHKKIIGDQIAHDKGGQIATEYMKALTEDGKNTPTKGYSFECLTVLRACCWNYADASLEFCAELGRAGAFSLLAADLNAFSQELANNNIRSNIILPCISILHNCAKEPDNKRFIKDAAAVEAIVPYTKVNDAEIKMIAMMTLAYIIEEKDNEFISADGSIIKVILRYLKATIQTTDHKYEGFSALEIVSGLMHLANNDSNKVIIVNEGILPMLVELMQKGDESEKALCAKTVWVLSFSDDNKEKITEEADMTAVLKELRNTSGAAKANASGALWVLGFKEKVTIIDSSLGSFGHSLSFFKTNKSHKAKKVKTKNDVQLSSRSGATKHVSFAGEDSPVLFQDEREKSAPPPSDNGSSSQYDEDSQEYDEDFFADENQTLPKPAEKFEKEDEDKRPETEQASSAPKHIMISYHWDYQKLMLRIRERLERHNYRIWIDVESMGGSTLQAMAEAVENSDAVLMCMSQKYKESPNCRTEAEYAYKLKKTLIPLRLESMYEPDGWLGALQGAKLYFDFSNLMTFEGVFSKLTKELGDKGRTISMDAIDGPSSPTTAIPAFSPPVLPPLRRVEPRISVEHWSKASVEQWAASHQIQSRKILSLDGESLIFLHNIKQSAPEFFYKYASDKLGFSNLRDLMNLCKGLDALEL